MRRIRGCVCLRMLSERRSSTVGEIRALTTHVCTMARTGPPGLNREALLQFIMLCRQYQTCFDVLFKSQFIPLFLKVSFSHLAPYQVITMINLYSRVCGQCVYTSRIITSWWTAVGSLRSVHHAFTSEPRVAYGDAEPALVWCPVAQQRLQKSTELQE